MGVADGVLWETCAVDDCRGSRLGAEGHCLLHCSDEALDEVLPKGEAPVELDARGVVFDQHSLTRVLGALPLHADQRRWLGSARFDGATFLHEVSFDETTFAGPASFAGATFKGDARFGGATFGGGVSFEDASFGRQAWFVGAGFRGSSSFADATFEGPAWFQRTTFSGSARFDRAAFSQNVTFNGAAFSSESSFAEAAFGGLAVFDKAAFGAVSSWDGARFSVEGQGPPAAAVPTPEAPAPSFGGGGIPEALVETSHPARRARAKRSRGDGSRLTNVLIPLLGLAVVAATAFVILRPDSGPVATEQLVSTTTTDPRDPTNQNEAARAASSTAPPSTLQALGSDTAYKFDFVGPTGKPARYNPCAPLRYVVNPSGAPDSWRTVLQEVVDEVSRATGMKLEMVGETDEVAVVTDSSRPSPTGEYTKTIRRAPFQPTRYPNAWAPLLIYWTELTVGPGAKPGFDTTGIGASERRSTTDGSPVYVTGVIALASDLEPRLLKPVLMHEFGHVLGLDHTDDPKQLMAASHDKPVAAWGAGDLSGLNKLGVGGGCINPPLPSLAPQTVITTPIQVGP
jgi:hypothetical protein